MQYPQCETVHDQHQPVNNNYQPQPADTSCLDNSVATSESMQYPQSENVHDQHQQDDNKYQPQLVDPSCLDNSVATSESMKHHRLENIQNQHCLGKPYLHLNIRTTQPQRVGSSH